MLPSHNTITQPQAIRGAGTNGHAGSDQQPAAFNSSSVNASSSFIPSSSFSSSYTSRNATPPSNFGSMPFTGASPSANPPPTSFLHRNSLGAPSASRPGSYDSTAQLRTPAADPIGSFGAPNGTRRSLLTSKLQNERQIGLLPPHQHQQQQQQQNVSSFFQQGSFSSSVHSQFLRNHKYQPQQQVQQDVLSYHNTPTHVSSSYGSAALPAVAPVQMASSYSAQTGIQPAGVAFPPQPMPVTATTDVSHDMAYSTTSSSSGTLYQDTQEAADRHGGAKNRDESRFQAEQTPGNPSRSAEQGKIGLVGQTQLQSQHPHFISSSAPVHTSFGISQTASRAEFPGNYQAVNGQAFNTGQFSLHRPLAADGDHLNIAEHPTQDLLLMLSSLLQKIVEANDLLHTETYDQDILGMQEQGTTPANRFKASVLAFHGRNIPPISLHAYLVRILKYCPMTNDVFLSLLVYFDRIAHNASELAESRNAGSSPGNGKQPPPFVIDSYNIHRLIISGVTVASKFFSDVFYKNSRYAKVGGLRLEELNHLELQFLLLLDFRLMIQVEEMNRYGDLLLRFWKRERLKSTRR